MVVAEVIVRGLVGDGAGSVVARQDYDATRRVVTAFHLGIKVLHSDDRQMAELEAYGRLDVRGTWTSPTDSTSGTLYVPNVFNKIGLIEVSAAVDQ